MALQLRFGTEEQVLDNIENIIPAEPVVATDTKRVFVGNDYGEYFELAKTEDLPVPSDNDPEMDGTASAGSSDDYARADHIHPKDTTKANVTDVETALATKVDKVAGKGLSENDFTNELKNKLDGIEAGAQVNPLPSSSTPLMDDDASAGTSTDYARADHIHPKDTSKPSTEEVEAMIEALREELYYNTFESTSVSGEIVHIDDGAGDVPIKALTIGIEAQQDLHGQDNPYPAGGGKNLLNATGTSQYCTKNDGIYTLSSIPSAATAFTIGTVDLKAGNEYKLSGGSGTNNFRVTIVVGGLSYASIDGDSSTINVTADETCNVTGVITNSATTGAKISPMVRLASQSADYAPYENICPITGFTGANVYVSPTDDVADARIYPVTWTEQGTIYGGYVDATRGKLTKTWGIVDMGDLPWNKSSTNVGVYWIYRADMLSLGFIIPSEYDPIQAICDRYKAVSGADRIDNFRIPYSYWYTQNGSYFGIYIPNLDVTAEQFKTQMAGIPLIYKLANAYQTEYDITPVTDIKTLLGVNNIWADTGDIENLTYRLSNISQEQIQLLSLNRSTPLLDRQLDRPLVDVVADLSGISALHLLENDEREPIEQEEIEDEPAEIAEIEPQEEA